MSVVLDFLSDFNYRNHSATEPFKMCDVVIN